MSLINTDRDNSQRLLDAFGSAFDLMSMLKLDNIFKKEARALHFIHAAGDDGISPSDLSCKLSVSRARVTVILATLCKKSYVSMSISSTDRRRSLAFLTERGREYYNDIYKRFTERMDKVAHDMGSANVNELIRLMISFSSILSASS